jgi:hypothetical protein
MAMPVVLIPLVSGRPRGVGVVIATNGIGLPVTEALNGFGTPITIVAAGKIGMPVVFVTGPLLREKGDERRTD